MLAKYTCPRCGNHVAKILNIPNHKVPNILPCAQCGGWLEREIGAPSLSSLEEVDNGAMEKSVVIRKDIKERLAERKAQYFKEIEQSERPFGNVFDEKDEL